jgi:hypothetical protein
MRRREQEIEPGTEELEQGLRPAAALDVARIASLTVVLLLVFNSAALLDWTRQARPGPVIAALEAPAQRWNETMVRIGTAGLFKHLHELARHFS